MTAMTDEMTGLTIGILGGASIARRMVVPALARMPEFPQVVVASRQLARAEELAELCGGRPVAGYERVLDDPSIDAVYIALPTGLHHHWARRALLAGKHCLIEKSLTANLADTEELVQLGHQLGLVVFENFMFLYHAQQQFIAEVIAAGELGELRSMRGSFGFPPLAPDNIRYRKQLGGGALLDVGAYPVKAAQLYLRPQGLSVRAANLHIGPTGVDLFGNAYLANDAGQAAHVAFGFDNCYQCSVELWGSRGRLVAKRVFTAGPGISPEIVVENADGTRIVTIEPDDHFENCLRAFHRCVVHGHIAVHRTGILTQARLMDKIFTMGSQA